jgi:hypothetical protein
MDRREQLMGCGALALALPQSSQTHGGAKLSRLRLLATGNLKGLLKTRLRLLLVRGRLRQ